MGPFPSIWWLKDKVITRRFFILFIGMFTGFLFLWSRLFYLQVIKRSRYQTLADGNRLRIKRIVADRGIIFDHNNHILAETSRSYHLVWAPDPHRRVKALNDLHLIAPLLQWTDEEKASHADRLQRYKRYDQPLIIEKSLPWEKVVAIEALSPPLAVLKVHTALTRHYRLGHATAHVLGYVGIPPEKKATHSGLLWDREGVAGLEKGFNETLTGTAGMTQIEINARGHVVRELAHIPPVAGVNLRTTLDMNLQGHLHHLLEGKGGAGIIMRVSTGEVITCCSSPSFDPEELSYGIGTSDWQDLQENPAAPMMNKPVQRLFPPGSTVKTAGMLAALESGIDVNHTVHCPGYLDFGGRRFHCHYRPGHGTITLSDALAYSCNVYFYQIARKLGINKLAETLRYLGLGSITGIELANEGLGIVPDNQWKIRHRGEGWRTGDSLNSYIGQGFLLATPIQLATMAARLAGGHAIHPSLISGTSAPSLPFNPKNLALVREAMGRLMNERGGVGYRYRIDKEGYRIAGKTGTAQVAALKYGRGKRKGLEDHGLFIGFGPTHDPQYACCITVEGGMSGGAAAQLASKIMLKAIEDKV